MSSAMSRGVDSPLLAALYELPSDEWHAHADWDALVEGNAAASARNGRARENGELPRGTAAVALAVEMTTAGRFAARRAILEGILANAAPCTPSDDDENDAGVSSFVDIARLAALLFPGGVRRFQVSPPVAAAGFGPTVCLVASDTASFARALLFEPTAKRLTIVVVETDPSFLPLTVAAARTDALCARVCFDDDDHGHCGGDMCSIGAVLWTLKENACLLPAGASVSPLNSAGGAVQLPIHCPAGSKAQGGQSQSSHSHSFAAAVSQAEALAHAMQPTTEEKQSERSVPSPVLGILPWVVALQRARHHHQSVQADDGTASLLSLPLSPSPLPSRDAPLFGAVVFPAALRSGYAAANSGALLPRAVMAFTNAKGAPVFKYDDEALEVLWKLVPGLRAAVAVYGASQRVELIRQLDVWQKQQQKQQGQQLISAGGDGNDAQASNAAAATTEDDDDEARKEMAARRLAAVVSSHIFPIDAALAHLYEKETTKSSSGGGSTAAAAVNVANNSACDVNGRASAVEIFVAECTATRLWRFSPGHVLSRRGLLSLRPVPPITAKAVERSGSSAVPPAAVLSGSGTTEPTAPAAGEEVSADVYTPSLFPDSFLSFAIQQVSARGVEQCENIAYDVFQTMRRLLTRH